MIIESRAFARAGMLGNPSDGYFGKTLSVIIKNFGADITLYESPELHFEPQESDTNTFRSIFHLRDNLSKVGYNGGIPLLKAAIKKFADYAELNNIRLENKNFTIRYGSSIPRQVGMAGSSAIIVATLRALMRFYKVEIPNEVLPSIALAAEVEELGITAGLQDRVIQVYEGMVYMDFNREFMEANNRGIYEPVPTELLPKLYIAYKTNLSKVSGKVLNNLRLRWERQEPLVVSTLQETADLARQGKLALESGNHALFSELINANFDNRCKIMNISDSNMELINKARACGVSASFTGSGGAIIGVYKDDSTLNKLFYELKKIEARVFKPYFN